MMHQIPGKESSCHDRLRVLLLFRVRNKPVRKSVEFRQYKLKPSDLRRVAFVFTMNEFYLSSKWKRKREQILRRDNYLCQNCKRYGRQRQAATVHHIKHYDEFPELALKDDNLISLCAACHNLQHPEKGGRKL